MAEFETPEFLKNQSADDIFEQMTGAMPADIDISQGSHAYNLTYPTALVVAELSEFILPEVIKLIFPEFSYGEYLDYHAQARGMARREAVAATGTLTITGTPDAVIPAESVFSTASVNEIPSVDYATTEEITIPSTGTVEATVVCTEAGIIGNTGINTVIISSSQVTGITSVTNTEEITGGIAEETDESLIQRIQEYDQSQGNSFVGNVSDYRRWAMTVPGVGNANVTPAQDESGTVTIVITDTNGEPANETLQQAVYNYIMAPDTPSARLAPVNALLNVTTPSLITINVSATIEIATEATTIASITTAYIAAVQTYLTEATYAQEIKYSKMAAILSSVAGVNDFVNFKIGTNGTLGTDNIPVSTEQMPSINANSVTFTKGTV